MSIFKKAFWDAHEIVKEEETVAEPLNVAEKTIIREFSSLKKAPPKYRKTEKVKNKMGKFSSIKLTAEEIECYSDDSDYDDDDVKKHLAPGAVHYHIEAVHAEDDAEEDGDEEDDVEDEDDVDADDAEEQNDADDADDAKNDNVVPAVQANNNNVQQHYDFWKITARFCEGGRIRSDAEVNAIVAALDPVTREKFTTDYRAVYKRAHDIVMADKMADRIKKSIRGIVNYLIYMGEGTYNNLIENMDDLQIALEYGDAFYPQVAF